MGSKKIIKVDTSLKKIDGQVKSQFKDVAVEEIFGALVTSKKMTDTCDNLYKKTKRHIEQNISPDQLKDILEVTEDPKKMFGQVVATNTLFGTEYLLGEVKWVVKKGGKAATVLLDAANSNPAVKEALDKAGIIKYDPTINYDAIHAVVDSLSSKDDIPAGLEILRSVCEIVETDKSVRVSMIKEHYKEEE